MHMHICCSNGHGSGAQRAQVMHYLQGRICVRLYQQGVDIRQLSTCCDNGTLQVRVGMREGRVIPPYTDYEACSL